MTLLERIRQAVQDQRYALTEHAYDELNADGLDVLDIESAILTGAIVEELTHDRRGKRYVLHGKATDMRHWWESYFDGMVRTACW